MKRGENLKGQDGALGRSLGGKAIMVQPAPDDCKHCQRKGYVTMAQHLGHRGLSRAARNAGFQDVEAFCRHVVALNDPYPENGYFQQWLRNRT